MVDEGATCNVSVVIVSFFTGPALFASIQSVLNEARVAELILVNNGNPPDVNSRLDELAEGDARIRLISGQGNVGFAAACNLGARLASRDFLLLLNPDGIFPAGGVEKFLAAGINQGETWLAGARILNSDGSEQQGSRREVLTPWLAFCEFFKLSRLFQGHPNFKPFNLHDRPVPDGATDIPVISGACMFMPRPAYQLLGGLDEAYFLHVEDIDFCLRFRRAGGIILFCPEVEIVHQKSSSDVSNTFVEWHKTKGFWTYFRKNFKDVYPPGFLGLMNFGIFCRFLLVAGKGFVRRLF